MFAEDDETRIEEVKTLFVSRIRRNWQYFSFSLFVFVCACVLNQLAHFTYVRSKTIRAVCLMFESARVSLIELIRVFFFVRYKIWAADTFSVRKTNGNAHAECNAIYLKVVLNGCLVQHKCNKKLYSLLLLCFFLWLDSNNVRLANQNYARATFNTVSQQLNSFGLQMNVFFAFK